jgi:MFS family permease
VLPLVGFASLTMLTAANATMQLGIEPTMRGRVMALYMTVLMGSTTIGSPVIGWIGQEFGPRWTLIVGGGLTVLGAVGSTLLFNHRRGLSVRPHLLPRPRLDIVATTTEPIARHAPTPAGRLTPQPLNMDSGVSVRARSRCLSDGPTR